MSDFSGLKDHDCVQTPSGGTHLSQLVFAKLDENENKFEAKANVLF